MLKELVTVGLLLLTTASFADQSNPCDNFSGTWHGQTVLNTKDGDRAYETLVVNSQYADHVTMRVTENRPNHDRAPYTLTGSCKNGELYLEGVPGFHAKGFIIGNQINLTGNYIDYYTSSQYMLDKDA